ncbi:MAG: hypothetical protein ACH346_06525 [Chthoniobacterales bacterium]
MIPLKSVFLSLSAALFLQALAQASSAIQSDVSSLPHQPAVTIEAIIIDDPSITFNEVDQSGIEHRFITAADYADFLNAEAVKDTENLYNEKMGSDPKSACIIRSGSPENYFYQVIEERGSFAVTYVTPKSAGCFLAWLENNLAPVEQSGMDENSSFCKIFSSAKEECPTEEGSASDQRIHSLPSAEEDTELTCEDNDFFLGSNKLGYCINIPSLTETEPLAETNSSWKNIFDYTPGATAGQRTLEGIGLYGGLAIGLALTGEILPLLAVTGPSIACICLTITIAIITILGCMYLGEKFGKWLGS